MPSTSEVQTKPREFSRLEGTLFDVLIIGGGITGAGIARDLALRGVSVALVEQNDFASGTSSRSTKLVHGGLRYLERFELGLVFEACRERSILQRIAPHLVRPLPLLIPLYRRASRSRAVIRAGLTLYDLLALFRNTHPHKILAADDALRRQPLLVPEGLTGAALYWDCHMDDARLCLENVIAARESGAVTVNYARVIGLLHHNGMVTGADVEDAESGQSVTVAARVVVNATGPWLDRVGMWSTGWTRRLRPTRGSHLLVPRLAGGDEALYLSTDRDARMFFVIPWGELSLIGTTDLDDERSPEHVSVSPEEITYLLEETSRYLPKAKIAEIDIISTFAGIRPLLAGDAVDSSSASREHAIFAMPDGLLSIGGGKYTTYRSMAAEMGNLVMARLDRPAGNARTDRTPLPGGQPGWEQLTGEQQKTARRQGLAPAGLRRLIDRYGSRTAHLLELIEREPELTAPIIPGHPMHCVEVAYAADYEMARTPEDVLRRRSGHALLKGHGLDAVSAVAAILEQRLGLSRTRVASTIATYKHTYAN